MDERNVARLHAIKDKMTNEAGMIKSLVPPVADTLILGAMALEETLNVIERLTKEVEELKDETLTTCPAAGTDRFGPPKEGWGSTVIASWSGEATCNECGKVIAVKNGKLVPHMIRQSTLEWRKRLIENY